jgi:integrase
MDRDGRAGLSGLQPHSSFPRAHPKFVQELLGHASVAITLDTYSHMLPGMGGEAADAIGEALG